MAPADGLQVMLGESNNGCRSKDGWLTPPNFKRPAGLEVFTGPLPALLLHLAWGDEATLTAADQLACLEAAATEKGVECPSLAEASNALTLQEM